MTIEDDIRAVAKIMDEADVPEDGRHVRLYCRKCREWFWTHEGVCEHIASLCQAMSHDDSDL